MGVVLDQLGRIHSLRTANKKAGPRWSGCFCCGIGRVRGKPRRYAVNSLLSHPPRLADVTLDIALVEAAEVSAEAVEFFVATEVDHELAAAFGVVSDFDFGA